MASGFGGMKKGFLRYSRGENEKLTRTNRGEDVKKCPSSTRDKMASEFGGMRIGFLRSSSEKARQSTKPPQGEDGEKRPIVERNQLQSDPEKQEQMDGKELDAFKEYFLTLDIDSCNKLCRFMQYVDENKLQFTRNPAEVKDIVEAASDIADEFVQKLNEKYPILTVSHKYLVGSMAEGTMIVEPDEFDFLLSLSDLESFVDQELKLVGDEGDNTYELIESRPPDNVHYIRLKLKSNDDIDPSYSTDDGYVYNFVEILNQPDVNWRFRKSKTTGILQGVSNCSSGPAITLDLQWITTVCNTLGISVDLVLALEQKGIQSVLRFVNTSCQDMVKALKDVDNYFLVSWPRHPGVQAKENHRAPVGSWFKYAFNSAEVAVMKNLSSGHKLCYRFMKYLFKKQFEEHPISTVQSFFLKTVFLHHVSACHPETNKPSCILDVLCLMIKLRKPKYESVIPIHDMFLDDKKLNNLMEDTVLKTVCKQLQMVIRSSHTDHVQLFQELERIAFLHMVNIKMSTFYSDMLQ